MFCGDNTKLIIFRRYRKVGDNDNLQRRALKTGLYCSDSYKYIRELYKSEIKIISPCYKYMLLGFVHYFSCFDRNNNQATNLNIKFVYLNLPITIIISIHHLLFNYAVRSDI